MSKIGAKESELRKMRESSASGKKVIRASSDVSKLKAQLANLKPGQILETTGLDPQKLTQAHKAMLADGCPQELLRTSKPASFVDTMLAKIDKLAVKTPEKQEKLENTAKTTAPTKPVGASLTRSQAKRLVQQAQSPENSPASEPKESAMTAVKKEAPQTAKKTTKKSASKKPAPTTRTAVKEKTTAKKVTRASYDWAEAEQKAKKGVLANPPDFSAATHKSYRKHFDQIVEWARFRDIKSLKADATKPKGSSRRILCRYRDIAITALNAK